MTLIKQFSSHIHQIVPNILEKKIYVAVSGGVDSMVLYHLCYKIGLEPTALHCNFNLRGEDSDLDENLVKSFSKKIHLDFKSNFFDTKEIASERKLSIQACARELRYEWFDTFLSSNHNSVLLTAHHLNDNVETFFTNLLRGTGIKGLTGIPEQRDQIYRPLLHNSKSDILNYAKENNVPFREDDSNNSLKYLRNKIRHSILPEIETISPNFQQKMYDLQSDLKLIDLFLENYTENIRPNIIDIDDDIHKINIEKLLALSKPILQKLLNPYNIQRPHISEIEKLCHASTGAIFENNHFIFLKNREQLLVKKQIKNQLEILTVTIKELPIKFNIGQVIIECSIIDHKPSVYEKRIAYLDDDKITLPILFTNQYQGLKIQPFGMKGTKLISDILSDAKLNRFDKEKQLIVIHKNDVLWLAKHTINQQYSLTEHSKRILKIEILE